MAARTGRRFPFKPIIKVGVVLFTIPVVMPFSQTDWPIPPYPSVSMFGTSQTTNPNVEIRNYTTAVDAGIPLQPYVPREGHGWTWSILPLNAPPFFQSDWPLPSPPRPALRNLLTWTNAVEIHLIGKDRFFGAAGQSPANTDWPLPRRSGRELGFIQGINPNLTTAAPAPFALTDWPLPIAWPSAPVQTTSTVNPTADIASTSMVDTAVPWQPETPAQRGWIASSVQLFTAVAAPPPIRQLDWPIPRRQTWVVSTDLRTVDVNGPAPFFQTAWPNPRERAAIPGLQTWVNSLRLLLLGKDLFFGGAGQPPANLDWPLPKRGGRELGFVQARRLSQDQFFGATGQPPANLDWPLPKRGGRELGFVQPLNLALTTAPNPQPFALTDWPVPSPRPVFSQLRAWSTALQVLLLGKDQFFGAAGQGQANLDWPLPRRVGRELGFVQSISLALTTAPAPFSQDEWLIPSDRPTLRQLRTWTDHVRLLLQGQDFFFGGAGQPPANLDWPVPKRGGRELGWIAGLNLPLIVAPNPQPVTQTDWPVPAERPVLRTIRTWTDPLKILLLGKDQFFGVAGQPPANLDWPLPRRGGRELGSIQPINLPLAVQPSPFAQDEWTVPLARREARWLRTWDESIKRLLLGKDLFFGGSGQPPANLDWPLPKTGGRPHGHVSTNWLLQITPPALEPTTVTTVLSLGPTRSVFSETPDRDVLSLDTDRTVINSGPAV